MELKKFLLLILAGLALISVLRLFESEQDTMTSQTTNVSRNSSLAGENKTEVAQKNCQLPPIWGEVQFIYKLCNFKQVEQSTGLTDTFSFKGGNGSFNYCNSLIWRKYTSDAGVLYTYEKIRYQHFPNSEVGEYRAPEVLYNEITNGRPCVPTAGGDVNDDDISAGAFPSRNRTIETYEPDYWASFFNRHYSEYHWGN